MELQIKELLEKDIWDSFVKLSPNCNFMQSWNWSTFQKDGLERETFRLGFFKGEELVAVAACYEISQTFGKYIYCSRGPILKNLDQQLYTEVLQSLKGYFREKEYLFLKIDPAIKKEDEISYSPLELGFKKCINYVQPETPWFTKLVGNTEEELMDWCKDHGMGKNYPTYIRKARRSGVTIRFSNDLPDWKLFTHYLHQSADVKDFTIQEASYYLKQLKHIGEYGELKLAMAEYEGEPVAMLILSFFGDEVSCLYSCQTGMQTKIRGAMLLRWECMLLAQREGYRYFNSWDVLSERKYVPSNPRYGYSNFKRGFGGYLVEYQRTMDYPYYKGKYFLVRLLDIYRRIRYYRGR